MSKSKTILNFSSFYLICDTKEDKLYRHLFNINQAFPETHRFQLLQKTLQTGDILIGYRHPSSPAYEITASQAENLGPNTLKAYPELREVQPLYLIERKTIQDFCQSYRSQHYQNQKTRMISFRAQNPTCHCFLVVEGFQGTPPSSFPKNFPKSTCESCFVSIRLRDHFFVKHVASPVAHAEFLHKCLRTIVRHDLIPDPNPITSTSSPTNLNLNLNLNQDYQQTVSVKKKTNMTPSLCYKVQLTAIPQISMNIAETITQHYPHMDDLIQHLKKEGDLALAKISLGKQKLGPAKSKRIYEFLVPPDVEKKPLLCLTSKN